jgi:hypothetical protein
MHGVNRARNCKQTGIASRSSCVGDHGDENPSCRPSLHPTNRVAAGARAAHREVGDVVFPLPLW